jgi:hypothetical protein
MIKISIAIRPITEAEPNAFVCAKFAGKDMSHA